MTVTAIVTNNAVMKKQATEFTFEELCTLVELPRRTVRYYIQMGLVDRPEGSNRGARYTTRHVDQLLTVRKWKNAGLSLERIRELVTMPDEAGLVPPPRPRQAGEVTVWSHITLAEGVELCIEPRRADLDPEQVRLLARQIEMTIATLKNVEEQ